jgi:hypothetical protein
VVKQPVGSQVSAEALHQSATDRKDALVDGDAPLPEHDYTIID